MEKKQRSISSFFASKATPLASRSVSNAQNQTPLSSPTNGLRGDSPKDSDENRVEAVSKNNTLTRKRSINEISSDDGQGPNTQKSKRVATPNGTRHATNGNARASHHDRTSKYLFNSSQRVESGELETAEDEDEQAVKAKEKLHQRFVKKLGRPDSIAEIKRRSHIIEDTSGEVEAEDGGSEEEIPSRTAPKASAAARKRGSNLTPMDRQFLEIKRKHMDTIIIWEVGYKYRFFGEDARTAAKELSIVCIPGKFRYDEHSSESHLDRFASASIPTHRLHVHVKRLVGAGHKVGIVRQIETAALKAAGDNRNAPFVRKLTNVYTKGTYVDEVEDVNSAAPDQIGKTMSTGHLLCITESNAKGWGTDEKVHVGIVAVQPSTGDIIYDDFEDGFMRSEIETRLLHISPCEFVIVGELSKATSKLVQHLSSSRTNVFGDRARVEQVEKPKNVAAQSFEHISGFYAEKMKLLEEADDANLRKKNILDKIHSLSENVMICLSAMITHLTEYGLHHVFDLTMNFQPFSARSHMLLNGNTLNSLEIYRNQTDYTERASLFWVLDQTVTRFGQRLLRKWVGRPLLDRPQLQERVEAVDELKDGSSSASVEKLRLMLAKIKMDLERSLIRIYYRKCTRAELLHTLQTLQRVGNEYATVRSSADVGFKSALLSSNIANLPLTLSVVVGFLDVVNSEAAQKDDKFEFFHEDYESEKTKRHKAGIIAVEDDLNEYRKEAGAVLKKGKVDYVTVAGIDYLIEVDNSQLKRVPASWMKISGKKGLSRFHTPEVVKLVRERDQHKESLAAACEEAFAKLLTEVSQQYQVFRDCIQSLATLDCLLSLASVASRPGYTKPTYVDDIKISISGGRHPMIEQLLIDSYVPNDINLSTSDTRSLLITGPNMGGKSSFVRQVALISIMGQIGSFVPAASAQLGMLDAVFTRMGAFDNMMAGESTFMVELSETSDILKQASPRSLVILDELGRGTSTHDGVAIAHAVLDYVVHELKSLTLFITHYQSLSTVANSLPSHELRNMHVKFEDSGDAEQQTITFLYELSEGVAHRSYGLNVARLANVPKTVTEVASKKSKDLEAEVLSSRLSSIARSMVYALTLEEDTLGDLETLINGIDQL